MKSRDIRRKKLTFYLSGACIFCMLFFRLAKHSFSIGTTPRTVFAYLATYFVIPCVLAWYVIDWWQCKSDLPDDPRSCHRCGFSLEGLPDQGICPECGHIYDLRD
ncbi:MAG: hypothetical protein GC200_01415 [Tepidisphaera sp.]|nr:hypothetical protein [Tepidisphaera sp.]